jgi:hypothetical protein
MKKRNDIIDSTMSFSVKKEKRDIGYVLCYDLKTLPVDMTHKDMKKLAEDKHIIAYDSSKGHRPIITFLGGTTNEYLKYCKIINIISYKSKCNVCGKANRRISSGFYMNERCEICNNKDFTYE